MVLGKTLVCPSCLLKAKHELEGILSGDPSQNATPEDRESWRASAVRYSRKLEDEKRILRSYMEAAINAHDAHAYREDILSILAILRKGLELVP